MEPMHKINKVQMLGAYNADAAIMEAQPISAGQTFSIADNNGTMTGISVVGQEKSGSVL